MNLTFNKYPDLSFPAWLLNQDTSNDAIGDLARALRIHRQYDFWSPVPETLNACHMYLHKAGFPIEAHEVLAVAWEEWSDLYPGQSTRRKGGD